MGAPKYTDDELRLIALVCQRSDDPMSDENCAEIVEALFDLSGRRVSIHTIKARLYRSGRFWHRPTFPEGLRGMTPVTDKYQILGLIAGFKVRPARPHPDDKEGEQWLEII